MASGLHGRADRHSNQGGRADGTVRGKQGRQRQSASASSGLARLKTSVPAPTGLFDFLGTICKLIPHAGSDHGRTRSCQTLCWFTRSILRLTGELTTLSRCRGGGGVKAAHPPLGLLTIAALFPANYELRVVDMNVGALHDADLEWVDLVFTSTMITQHVSLHAVIERCNRAGVPVVAGGPHPTTFHAEIRGVDHFVLDEVEETFAQFLRDLEGGTAKRVYRETRKPDVTRTPIPRFDLIDIANYAMMSVQFSRGCPFECEFCDIIKLYGRVPRTKLPEQVLKELDCLYRLGWLGRVFLVDDNFIGNKRDALRLLPVIAEWQKARGYPFTLITEASANLALMDAMMDAMVDAGFDTVFVGIETPNANALLKTKKQQNTDKTQEDFLHHAVRKIQRRGMQVQGGFIFGLDSDHEGVFDAQIEFIQETGIPVAPIYLLSALKGTDMYARTRG